MSVVHETLASSLPGVNHDSLEVADKPAGPFQTFSSLHGRSISELGMKHGDMLFLRFEDAPPTADLTSHAVETIKSTANKLNGPAIEIPKLAEPSTDIKNQHAWKTVQQHAVDDLLEKQSGKIPRKRDNKMCKHGLKGMCDYCMPLERKGTNHIVVRNC